MMIFSLLMLLAGSSGWAQAPAKPSPKTGVLSFQPGRWWEYKTDMGTAEPTLSTQKVGGFEDFNGEPAFYYATEVPMKGGRFVTKIYYAASESGISMVGNTSAGEFQSGEDTHAKTEARTIYKPPMLSLPNEWKIGAQWEAQSVGESHTSMVLTGQYPSDTNTDSTLTMSLRSKVASKETVTVPAGTFECWVIESETKTKMTVGGKYGSESTSEGTTRSWFSSKLGQMVKTEIRSSGITIVGGKEFKTSPSITMILERYGDASNAPASLPETRSAASAVSAAPAELAAIAPPAEVPKKHRVLTREELNSVDEQIFP